MAIQYDIEKIFDELKNEARKKQIEKLKKENSKESPEDAPKTQEVAPATSKTTEYTHGGDEASKEIKYSPNSAKDGENNNPNNSEKDGKNHNLGSSSKDVEDNDSYSSAKDAENNNSNSEKKSSGESENSGKNHSKTVKSTENHPKTEHSITDEIEKNLTKKHKVTQEELKAQAKEILERKRDKEDEFKRNHREEYLKKYMLEIIKKIAAQHAGIDKQDGSESYDKKQMLEHIVKKENYKILGDKYDLRDARYVQFFIDTSGVYGCGSNKILNELMPQVINLLEKQGYECYIAACGNGFYSCDMVEDEYYGTRKTLESYKVGKVSKIACPTPKTAAKMANEAEFSIILADFDGLSSICEMANLCQKDKVPYLLSTEDRYPWEDPTLHDWVDPDLCEYNPELVYDVSMDGNPSLMQYQESIDYEDYENDDYENDDYENDDYENDDYENDNDY